MGINILSTFDIGRRALQAHQQVLDTVGHNLANAATPGYTRQRAELTPVNPQEGVEVSQIIRIRDRFLDALVLDETGTTGLAQGRKDVISRIEALFQDPSGTGLDAAMDQLFASFQDLSLHPTDQAARVAAVDAGDRLASTFNRLQQQLDGLKADLVTDATLQVADVNDLLGQVAALNARIMRSGGQPAPNDLLDQRDALVSQLGTQLGVVVSTRDDGSLQVNPVGSGVLLVDGTSVATIAVSLDGTTDSLAFTAGGNAFTPRTGRLAALVEQRSTATATLKHTASDLDALAHDLIDQVNRVHAGGAGLVEPASVTAGNAVTSAAVALTAAGLAYPPGTGSFRVVVHDATGAVLSDVSVSVTAGVTTLDDVRAALDADPNITATVASGVLTISAASGATLAFGDDTSGLFAGLGVNTFFSGSDARSIAVDATVAGDPRRVATSPVDASGLVHSGDGATALALAQLRTALVASGGTDTLAGAYAKLVSRVGGDAREAENASDRQDTSLQLAKSFQDQVSGVSTDEELISLTQSQHAYAAAARFVTTIDEVIQTLLAIGT